MPQNSPLDIPAASVACLIRNKELSPVELMRATLQRVERLQPVLNCFITVCEEEALAAARVAEKMVMNGQSLGPAHGLPFTAKDMINTKGVRTTFGSLTLKENIPDKDDLAIARMKSAGAILIGKTTTPEFAHSALTQSPLFGRTRNVWHEDYTSGGSSGGGAVALAAGLTPMAVETDSGGSVRIPASCNGVVGMKQTVGLIPDDTSLDVFNSLISVTPMARSVADVAFMLDILKGSDRRDPFSIFMPLQDMSGQVAQSTNMTGLKIALLPPLEGCRIDSDVAGSVAAAATILAEMGAEIDDDPSGMYPDSSLWERERLAWTVLQGSLRLNRYAGSIAAWREQLSESFLRLVEGAESFTSAMLQDALFTRSMVYETVQAWFERFDLVMAPTLTRTALPIDHDLQNPFEVDGQMVGNPMESWFPHTHAFNLSGHPSLSVPCGFDRNGLPIGLQIIGPWGTDGEVLRCAAALEAALGSVGRRPDTDLLE